jgi:hypothetical protein
LIIPHFTAFTRLFCINTYNTSNISRRKTTIPAAENWKCCHQTEKLLFPVENNIIFAISTTKISKVLYITAAEAAKAASPAQH